MTDNETDLIKRSQRGDREAFARLLDTYYQVIFKMAYKWCGNREDAEDITQAACIKLARSLDSFNFKAAFSSWLYRLVINTGKDWLRKNSRTGLVSGVDEMIPTDCKIEDKLEARQTLAHVFDLPDNEKTALILVFHEGMTHKDAAYVMDCKESTVSWYIHEARKKLNDIREKEARHG